MATPTVPMRAGTRTPTRSNNRPTYPLTIRIGRMSGSSASPAWMGEKSRTFCR